MATAGRDLKLVDKCRLLRALRAGGTGVAAPGVRKARSRSRRERRPMAQAGCCKEGKRETGRCAQPEPGPPAAPPTADRPLLPGGNPKLPRPSATPLKPGSPKPYRPRPRPRGCRQILLLSCTIPSLKSTFIPVAL